IDEPLLSCGDKKLVKLYLTRCARRMQRYLRGRFCWLLHNSWLVVHSHFFDLRNTNQKQCCLRVWCAVFHLGSIIGPFRILTMQSQGMKPTSRAAFMNSMCAH